MPQGARAGFFSIFTDFFEKPKEVKQETKAVNAQTMNLLQAVVNPDPNLAKGGGDITVIGGTALLSENGPTGTSLEVEENNESGTISVYIVRQGDTLSGIAKLFSVSSNTIRWANDIRGSIITPGQTLVILPVSGVRHTIAKNDTLKSVAKKYKADESEIAKFNNIEEGAKLAVGDVIIIPDGEIAPSPTAPTSRLVRGISGPRYEGYYMRPILGGIKTQGLHGYNGVDLASFYGAPIFASADGVVIISRTFGWNAGYGIYVVIQHGNGTQTLYGHLSKTLVAPGERVMRGQTIGEVGSTGKSTGNHVHFEIRGAANPF